jgi:hypothetical protein
MPHIQISIPTKDSIRAETVTWLMSQHSTKDYYIDFKIVLGGWSVEAQRNAQVLGFLEDKNATHLLLVESDVVPPIDAVGRLLSHNVDIVAGVCPIYIDGNAVYNTFVEIGEGLFHPLSKPDVLELAEVDGIGMGCTLIARKVLEEIPPPWFEIDADIYGIPTVSEDFWFCTNVRKHGFKIHVDWNVRCVHHKNVGLFKEVYGIGVEQMDMDYNDIAEYNMRLAEKMVQEFNKVQ